MTISKMNRIVEWIDTRLPVRDWYNKHFTNYYLPKNFNIWYLFGSLALIILLIQIVTGIWLAMYYVPTSKDAFASIEYIMREVHFGWLLRYMHTTGASLFFVVIYLHMFRSLLYGSHQKPRELVWLLGTFLYVLLIIEAFTGYLLPWGQMSYWGAQVITSLFGTIPGIGKYLIIWVRGDFAVSGATLNRFYALHTIAIPLVFLFFVFLHITALRHVGPNNPDGIDISKKLDTEGKPLDMLPFHPYYTIKDLWGLAVFFVVFFCIVFLLPDMQGYFLEPKNSMPANPLQTPANIGPMWYLTPFYAILRAIPDKLFGALLFAASIAILFLVPWLDRCQVKSIRYRGILCKLALFFLVISFAGLGYLGSVPVTSGRQLAAQIFTLVYFLFFLLMPFYTAIDRTKPLPEKLR